MTFSDCWDDEVTRPEVPVPMADLMANLTLRRTAGSVADLRPNPVDVSSPGRDSDGVAPSHGEIGAPFGGSRERAGVVVDGEARKGRVGFGVGRGGGFSRGSRIVVRYGSYRGWFDADLTARVQKADHAHAGGQRSHAGGVSGAELAREAGRQRVDHGSGLIPNEGDTGTRGHESDPTPERCGEVCTTCKGFGGFADNFGGYDVDLGDCAACGGSGVR